jgi:hypothetical protein
LDDLEGEVSRRGPGYLLTASGSERPHVMQLRFSIDGHVLRATVGRSAARDLVAQPAATLLWPPFDDTDRPDLAGYSLIVDATGTIEGEATAVLSAVSAVLHRPA